MNLEQYDVILIGAGLVGASLVVALQNQGLKVAVLETHLPDVTANPKKDTRPLSLSYSSSMILQTLNIWPELEKFACPIKSVHVSDAGALGAIHFSAREQHVSALGYVVPFGDLQHALYQRAAEQPNVDFIAITQLMAIRCEETGATVTVNAANGEREITASLVVAADGTHSTSRDLLKIPTERSDRGDVALAAEIYLNGEHEYAAFERFTREGTLALLPLFNRHRCRLVWSMHKDMARDVAQWGDEKFKEYIENSFAGRIPAIEKINRGGQFPLQTIIAKEQIRPGFVLLGNAAHTLYPVAAQGFNLGLRDVAVLAETLVNARSQLESIGDLSVLQAYVEWRVSDQERVAGLTDSISHLFGLQIPLLKPARGLGLLATDLILPIKKRLAKRLMGLGGRLPKLARGIGLGSHVNTN